MYEELTVSTKQNIISKNKNMKMRSHTLTDDEIFGKQDVVDHRLESHDIEFKEE